MKCDPIDRAAAGSIQGCAAACGCGSRRNFVTSMAAFGVTSALAARTAWAQGAAPAPASKPHRIDVHHHFFPQFLLDAWQKAGVRNPSVVQNWRREATLEQMDRGGVATAIMSLPSGLNL